MVLTGDVPSPASPPPGCHFHTRCPAAQEGLCDVDDPVLREVRPGHFAACHLVTDGGYPKIRSVEDLAATVAILHRGRITARGTLDALVAQHHASALRLTFDGPVPAAVRATPGVTADGPVAQLPCPDPAATAAQLLARLDPDDTPLRTLEIDRPSLETVFLAATHAPPTPDPAAEPVPA